MKRFVIAAVAALSLGSMVAADTADAQSRRFRGRTTVITPASPGIDVNTLLLLGAMGGGAAGLGTNAALPLALLGAAVAQPQTTVVERRGRRR